MSTMSRHEPPDSSTGLPLKRAGEPVIHVVHAVAGLARDAGGPSRVVPELCEHLAAEGVRLEIVTNDLVGRNDEMVLPDSSLVQTHVVPRQASTGWSLTRQPSFRRLLVERCRNADLLHDNGLWLESNRAAASVARCLRKPLVVTVHGMLTPWARNHKKWKKHLAWNLFARRHLDSATLLHATSDSEADGLRVLFPNQPIAVIPNGINRAHVKRNPVLHPREVLFLSRIHPVKGLENLIEAWARVRPCDWRLTIAGPDENGHRHLLQRKIDGAGLGDGIRFLGAVEGKAKDDLYSRASLFVLPSFTENFGLVVAEALAAGVPVITTRGAPWNSLVQNRCGWWIELGVPPLEAALREAIGLTDQQRDEMGARGRHFVEQNFTWNTIAAEMREAYEWVLNVGARPSCVRAA